MQIFSPGQIKFEGFFLLPCKAMSAERLRLIQLNQFIIEKIKAARNLANIMYRKTPDNSSQEPYLSVISDLLDESADMLYDQIDCMPPADESTDKIITIVPAPAPAPAKPDRKTIWTEEKKKAQSEKLKERWAAKKAAAIHHD
jgi:hypothetical protein